MSDQLDRWLMRNPMPDATAGKEVRREYFASMPDPVKRAWSVRKGAQECEAPEFNAAIVERATKRLARVDAMPRELRLVVYEYGLEIVQEFINCGVTMPSRIKHLIDVVRNADFENGQRRFKLNKGPNAKRNPADEDEEYYTAR